jgi:hypothetical protein
MAEDLEQLKQQVETLATKVSNLKGADAAGADNKDAIGAAVQELLAAKKKYAENNNGIGVDGKPYVEIMTKSEKKKKEKGTADSGPAKTVSSDCCALSWGLIIKHITHFSRID